MRHPPPLARRMRFDPVVPTGPEVAVSGELRGAMLRAVTVRTSSRVPQPGRRPMKSHRMNRTSKCVRPAVESLEDRCLLSGMGPLPDTASAAAGVDVLTYHNDNSRTGAN